MSGTISLNGYDIGEIAGPLKEALSICQCAEDAAMSADSSAYIGKALSVAVSFLLEVEENLNNLRKQAEKGGAA